MFVLESVHEIEYMHVPHRVYANNAVLCLCPIPKVYMVQADLIDDYSVCRLNMGDSPSAFAKSPFVVVYSVANFNL